MAFITTTSNETVSLSLLGVRAEASIKELAAQVKLTQTYGNDATFPIEAKYSFPVPARASVCSFVMIKQDGTRVVGSVLEKQEARETYDTAVAQGQQASLMEQQTPDVFQVSVGNIPSNEQVQIELVYATELSEDEENDSIRFHLPVHIGARYGQAPQSKPSFRGNIFISSSSPTPFLTLAMSVEAIAPISKIGCPSHSVSTELGPDPKLPNFKELPFSNYARVSLSSDSPLDKDFVLTIKSAGLDAPRCVAELHPEHDTVALGLTLVPRFKLPDLSRQEFVFMVDRSGSMGGKRIEAAKKALVIMLRALPHQDSLFQITSFGSRATSLWGQGSQPYNQQTLEEATRHVDAMRADYGGTEIRAALQHCFKARKMNRPMSLLVLTDGDAWDLDGVLGEVKAAVAGAPKGAYLRVSVLGIGNSASTAMCEGMARVGNGTCMMVGEEETTFTGKIARMLKAAKTPPISNISVDWGRPAAKEQSKGKGKEPAPPDYDDDFEIVEPVNKKKTLNIFDESVDDPMDVDSTPAPPPPPVVLADFPPVQQAPFKIHNLFPSIRLNIYGILQGKTIPNTVTIRGNTAEGAEIELPVPVTLSHLQNALGAPPAVHALAARKVIQDLEDGQHALKATLGNPDDTDLLARTVKASIVRLGKTYSVVSSHTSFVAVDETTPAAVVYARALPPPSGGFVGLAPAMSAQPPLAKRMSAAAAGASRTRGGGYGAQMFSVNASFASSSVYGGSPGSLPPANNSGPTPRSFRTPTSVPSSAPRTARLARSIAQPMVQAAPAAPSPRVSASSSASFGSTLRSSNSATAFDQIPGGVPGGGTSFASARGSVAYEDQSRRASVPMAYMASSIPGQVMSAAPQLQQQASLSASYFEPPLPSTAVPRGRVSVGRASAGPVRTGDPLEALARLQAFDGCFSLEVLSVISLKSDIQAVRAVFPAGAADGVVASVLAMAFLSTKLGAGVNRDTWEGIYEKAQQYVEDALQKLGSAETAEGLEAKVVQLLV
ncbi:von Willebrand factor type A domain-containing protein [Mycena olivaceomarginata]|nr:von Willebrand factor type A domain-containing protein [Mycena olivaceomarginata]